MVQTMGVFITLLFAGLPLHMFGERVGPSLESDALSKESVLLQRNAHEMTPEPLQLAQQLGHLPLCDPLIVDETCRKVTGVADGPSPSSVTWALLSEMLSTASLEVAQTAMELPVDESAVGCRELCTAALQYVRSSGGILPPFSNVACRTFHGNTTCDVEADPDVLARKLGSIEELKIPDHGPLTDVRNETTVGSDSDGHAFLYQQEAGHISRGSLSAALLQRGVGVGAGAASNASFGGHLLQYSAWEAVERIANLFCVHPSSGKEVDVFVSSEPALLQEGTSSADATVAYRAAEAKAWLTTVLRNVNANQEAAAQRQWFGGAGNMNTEAVRQRILQTFNFINREFVQGFYYVVPAENAKQSVCNQGAVAYVWRASVSPTTGYVETNAPRCNSNDNPRTKNCALDQYGKYYMYLCNSFLSQGEAYQVSVLIHEAAHHAGPNDVTYNKDQMQRESQYNQLMNAANYQYFAQTVAEGGCGDKDGNCRHYTSYCNQANIKDKCQRTCGLCSGGGSGSGSGGGSSGGGGSGACADQDGNCRYYTSYCNTENVKAKCRKTCGLCSAGSGGGGSSSSGSGGAGGCADEDGNCRYYTSYCNTDNVKAKCRKTCGLCGSGGGGGASCADTYGSCKWYKDNGYCSTASVLAQCKRTCGSCR